jgi:hypothetical protein
MVVTATGDYKGVLKKKRKKERKKVLVERKVFL